MRIEKGEDNNNRNNNHVSIRCIHNGIATKIEILTHTAIIVGVAFVIPLDLTCRLCSWEEPVLQFWNNEQLMFTCNGKRQFYLYLIFLFKHCLETRAVISLHLLKSKIVWKLSCSAKANIVWNSLILKMEVLWIFRPTLEESNTLE